ncbi:hypothetical protein ACIHAX_30265 [Nocardia sp. NPDC051929]|uniref:hypothetical protein n=1 Tax=unclassified Nocardia TaxID=2637762 RepID=UPI00342B3EDC
MGNRRLPGSFYLETAVAGSRAYLAVTEATNEAVRRILRDGGDLLALEDAVMYIHRALLGLATPAD